MAILCTSKKAFRFPYTEKKSTIKNVYLKLEHKFKISSNLATFSSGDEVPSHAVTVKRAKKIFLFRNEICMKIKKTLKSLMFEFHNQILMLSLIGDMLKKNKHILPVLLLNVSVR